MAAQVLDRQDQIWCCRALTGLFQHSRGAVNPIGRAYCSFSTLLCTPASLSQDVGLALGAQAGEARIREVVTSAGFGLFRRASETPFNIVYEARP